MDDPSRPAARTPELSPIFIFGIAQRSGTHYIFDLLLRHPDCRPATTAMPLGAWEDHLLHFSDDLANYADRVVASNPIPDDGRTRRLLLQHLGAGLEAFLAELENRSADRHRRPVTKTPLAENLDRFSELFPGSVAVCITRDPRAVVASATKTFGLSEEHWIRLWRDGARWILRGLKEHPETTVCVRYEALYADPETELRKLLPRIGLDPDRYPFEGVRSLPVRGSSQIGRIGSSMTWQPVVPGQEFDPLGRGSALPSTVNERITWLALPEMRELGYADDDVAVPPPVRTASFKLQSGFDRVSRAARLVLKDTLDLRTRRARRRGRRPPATG